MATKEQKTFVYIPNDPLPWVALFSLGFQQFLTIFPVTVLVAIVGV